MSTLYPQPAYQAGIVPNPLATALPDGSTATTPMRVAPDVSMDGDNSTGLLVGYTSSSPTATSRTTRNGGRTPVSQIYARYGTSAYTDVTDGSTPITTALRTFGQDGDLHATTGFDDVTGVGAPSADYVGSCNGSHPRASARSVTAVLRPR